MTLLINFSYSYQLLTNAYLGQKVISFFHIRSMSWSLNSCNSIIIHFHVTKKAVLMWPLITVKSLPITFNVFLISCTCLLPVHLHIIQVHKYLTLRYYKSSHPLFSCCLENIRRLELILLTCAQSTFFTIPFKNIILLCIYHLLKWLQWHIAQPVSLPIWHTLP